MKSERSQARQGYPYTRESSRDNRQLYMYSKFQGEAFFGDYEVCRGEAISTFTNDTLQSEAALYSNTASEVVKSGCSALRSLLEALHTSQSAKPRAHADRKSSGDDTFNAGEEVITCELLDALIHSFLTGDYENRTWLVDKLVQRFEVTKSIRSRYNSSLSKHTSEETSSALDEKFGLCLSLAYAHTAKLTYLNALLKLNDFLIFSANLANTKISYLTYLMIRFEMKMVWSLRNAPPDGE